MIVEISCKPYVATYIKTHFTPVVEDGVKAVDLSKVRYVSDFFLNLLSRGSTRFDKRTTLSSYSDTVSIFITSDEFNRYGFEMTRTDMLRFNTFIEDQIKGACRMYVGIHHRNRGMMVAKAIRRFQDEFGFSENDFQFATIKKDIQRNVDFDNLFGQHKNQQLSIF